MAPINLQLCFLMYQKPYTRINSTLCICLLTIIGIKVLELLSPNYYRDKSSRTFFLYYQAS